MGRREVPRPLQQHPEYELLIYGTWKWDILSFLFCFFVCVSFKYLKIGNNSNTTSELFSSKSEKLWSENILPLTSILPKCFMMEMSLKQLCKIQSYLPPFICMASDKKNTMVVTSETGLSQTGEKKIKEMKTDPGDSVEEHRPPLAAEKRCLGTCPPAEKTRGLGTL